MAINTVLEEGNAESTLEALQNEHLDLTEVHTENGEYYFQGLQAKKQEKEVGMVCRIVGYKKNMKYVVNLQHQCARGLWFIGLSYVESWISVIF